MGGRVDQPNFWGDLVRTLRAERRIAQRTLATGVGMNRSTIRNIEDGKTRDILRIEAVLVYFGYDLEALSRENANMRERLPSRTLNSPT
jgi:DNA-binding XRE family transcriptional regulator